MLTLSRVDFHFEQVLLGFVLSNNMAEEGLECGALVQLEITELTLVAHHIPLEALSFQVTVFFTKVVISVFLKNDFGDKLLITNLARVFQI